MGLKLQDEVHKIYDTLEPQSNQRGIETKLIGFVHWAYVARLNRTSVGLKLGEAVKVAASLLRLNRTSVGLKLLALLLPLPFGARPQSNQRGIETGSDPSIRYAHSSPQSNQRGIETFAAKRGVSPRSQASIEPAWD